MDVRIGGMDGINGYMDEGMDGWIYGWMDGKDECMNERMRWVNDWID